MLRSATKQSLTLITDVANHHALKCLLTRSIVKSSNSESKKSSAAAEIPPVDVVIQSITPLTPRMPLLKVPVVETNVATNPDFNDVDQFVTLFHPTEMVRYILTEQQADPLSEETHALLDWESTVLSTVLAPLYENRTRVPELEQVLTSLNQSLAANGSSTASSSDDAVWSPPNDSWTAKNSVAEIILWCALLPALCDGGILEADERSTTGKYAELIKWFREDFFARHQELIDEAFSQLRAEEAADFLRVSRRFEITPPSDKTFYVTTPIYYVNASPHIGHVYTTLIADCLNRYHKMKGEKTFFMTGTDEHGQKIATAAAAKNQTPQEFTTDVANSFKQCFSEMKFEYDHFVRTTDPEHEATVQEMWKKLEAKGDIYLGKHEGWYCVSDETFVTEKDVGEKEGPNGETIKISLESGHPVTWVTEENYKFRLSKYQQPLLDYYRNDKNCVTPEFRRQEVIRFVENELIDLSISRNAKKNSWGIPVPGNPDHTIYVWLDALSNYYTVGCKVKDNNSGPNKGKKADEPGNFETRWPPDCQVMGKDILKFHAIYWPAFLLSAELPLPKQIVAHGWWTKDHAKISKSTGNVFDPVEKSKEYSRDALKYFLLRDSSFNVDGDYSDSAMVARLHGELADTLGNLVLRCVSSKLNAERKWTQPVATDKLLPIDNALIQRVKDLPGTADHYYLVPNIQKASIAIFDVLRDINQYCTDTAPWKLVKSDPDNRLPTVLYVLCEATRICITLLSPILPETSGQMLDMLGVPTELRQGVESWSFGKMEPGTPLCKEEDLVSVFSKEKTGGASGEETKKAAGGKDEKQKKEGGGGAAAQAVADAKAAKDAKKKAQREKSQQSK